jgi:uncharacterized protein YqeY
MTLKERINADFMLAFKAKDMVRKNFLGILKGEIQNEEGRGTVATDAVVMTILKKMEKSLKLSNSEETLTELGFMEPYLPTMMTYDEIETVIQGYYNDKGLSTIGAMMKEFNANYLGKADNKEVSSIINKTIAGR